MNIGAFNCKSVDVEDFACSVRNVAEHVEQMRGWSQRGVRIQNSQVLHLTQQMSMLRSAITWGEDNVLLQSSCTPLVRGLVLVRHTEMVSGGPAAPICKQENTHAGVPQLAPMAVNHASRTKHV